MINELFAVRAGRCKQRRRGITSIMKVGLPGPTYPELGLDADDDDYHGGVGMMAFGARQLSPAYGIIDDEERRCGLRTREMRTLLCTKRHTDTPSAAIFIADINE
nr:hypothetical protein CFP56_54410 [Quercus suber]